MAVRCIPRRHRVGATASSGEGLLPFTTGRLPLRMKPMRRVPLSPRHPWVALTLVGVAAACSSTAEPIPPRVTGRAKKQAVDELQKAASVKPAEALGPEMGSRFEADPSEPLPPGAVARLGTTRMRAASPQCVAVTDAGRIWAIDRVEGKTILRDVEAGKDEQELRSAAQWVIEPSARWMAAEPSGTPGVVTFFEVPSARVLGSAEVPLPERMETGKNGKPFKVRAHIVDMMVSPDGLALVAVTSEGAVHAIDPATFKSTKAIKVPPQLQLRSLSAKGRRGLFVDRGGTGLLAMTAYGPNFGYAVVDLATGAIVRQETFKRPTPDPTQPSAVRTPDHGYDALAISVDGTKLFRSDQGDVDEIDLKSGRATPLRRRPADALSLPLTSRLEVLADGARLLVDDEIINRSGESVRKLEGSFVASSSNGEIFVDRRGSRYFRSPSNPKTPDGAQRRVESLVFLPDGKTLVATDGGPIFWDTETGRPKSKPAVKATDLVSAPQKPMLMLGGEESLVVDERGSTRKLESVRGGKAAAFSPDGSELFAALGYGYDSPAELGRFSIAGGGGKAEKTRTFPSPIHRVAVAPDGGALVVSLGERYGSKPASLELLDPRDLSTRKHVEVERPGVVAFAGDKVALVSDGDGIVLLSKDSLERVGQLKRGACCDVAAVSPNGKLAAGASSRTVAVWSIESGKLLGLARGHREHVTSIAFSPDSRFLATSSADTSVMIWKVDSLPRPRPVTTTETVTTPDLVERRMGGSPGSYRVGPRGNLERVDPKAKKPLPAISGVRKLVSSGPSHCAVAGGKVQCWGFSYGGVLGVPEERSSKGIVQSRDVPVAVPGVRDAVDLFIGGSYACALETNGDLICWGRLDSGAAVSPPAKVLSAVKTMAIGPGRACAADGGGTVRCWTARTTPAVVPGSTFVSFALGAHHVCLLDRESNVHCFGENGLDQLGDGSGVDREEPVVASGLADVVSIAAEGDATCAITKKREVHCWGALPEPGLMPTPTRVKELDGAAELHVGYRRVCGRFRDGSGREEARCVSFSDD